MITARRMLRVMVEVARCTVRLHPRSRSAMTAAAAADCAAAAAPIASICDRLFAALIFLSMTTNIFRTLRRPPVPWVFPLRSRREALRGASPPTWQRPQLRACPLSPPSATHRLLLHRTLSSASGTRISWPWPMSRESQRVWRYANALQDELFTGHGNFNRLIFRNHVLAYSYLAAVDVFVYPQHFTEKLYSIDS